MSACDELRPLVSALEDGELSASEAALVRSHLETCAACRQVRDDHARLSALVTAHASPPAIEASRWAELERKLDLELAGSSPPSSMRERRLAPLVALRPLLAAAAGAVLALGLARSLVFQEERIAVAFTPRHLPELSFREPSVTGLATGDEKPLPRGLEGVLGADAARSLTKAQREALERDGLVQVPGSGASLDPFYGERAAGSPRPLVTADAALLVFQGAVRRASLEVERVHLAPGLGRALEALGRELAALDESSPPALRRAIRLAREVIGVARALEGLDPLVSDESREAVLADARLAREATGRASSSVLGREIDWGAFVPRGDLALVPEHARTVSWLAHAGLRLDSEHRDEARAAALIVLALAKASVPGGASLLSLWNDLDDAATFLHGPPDELGAFDLLRATRRALGSLVDPGSLGSPEALEKLLRVAQEESRLQGKGEIALVSSATPRFVLVGEARSLEGIVLSALSEPALPGRSRPTSLDLLGALGSQQARTIASSEGARGYDRALERLAPVVADATELPRATASSSSGIERSRIFALARLVGRPPASAPFAQRTLAYEERLVMAALAGLNAAPAGSLETGAAGPLPPQGGGSGSEATTPANALPAIEPLPGFYARLAYGAKRLALGLEASAAPRSRSVERACERLVRASEILSGLARASAESLEGKSLSPESRAALAAFAPIARALAPREAWSAEDVHVVVGKDGSRELLERTSGPIDALYLVLPVPGEKTADGSPALELTRGPALSAREVVRDARLTEADVARSPRSPDPSWATHIVAR